LRPESGREAGRAKMSDLTWRGWEEICEKSKLCRKVIRDLMKREQNPFPIVMIGGRYMTTKEKYEKWLEAEINNQTPERNDANERKRKE